MGFGWLDLVEVIDYIHSCLQWSCHIWQILFPTDVALNNLSSSSSWTLAGGGVIQMSHIELSTAQFLILYTATGCGFLYSLLSTQKRSCLWSNIVCWKPSGVPYISSDMTRPLLILSRSWGKDLNAKDRTCRKWARINLEESSLLASFRKVVADFWACYQGGKSCVSYIWPGR